MGTVDYIFVGPVEPALLRALLEDVCAIFIVLWRAQCVWLNFAGLVMQRVDPHAELVWSLIFAAVVGTLVLFSTWHNHN